MEASWSRLGQLRKVSWTLARRGIDTLWSTVKPVVCPKGSLEAQKGIGVKGNLPVLKDFDHQNASKIDPKSSLYGRPNVLKIDTTFLTVAEQFLETVLKLKQTGCDLCVAVTLASYM